ncbi:MAG: hypothetical protein R2744_09790 [Bacteroidales bacterium]
MEGKANDYLLIPTLLMWFLVAVNYLFAILWITGNITLEESGMLFGFLFGIVALTWILFLVDALIAEIYQKSFWIISLVVLPLVTYPVYLVRRRKTVEM